MSKLLLLAAVVAGLAGVFLLWNEAAAAPGLTAVFDALTPAPEAPGS